MKKFSIEKRIRENIQVKICQKRRDTINVR